MAKIILCHCEDVEIEELYSALEQGYSDLETLKRYTGIGTGKCQGKCCFVQTLRLLADIVEQRANGGFPRGRALDYAGDPTQIRVPTLRPPVLPLRIDDIVDSEADDA